MKDYFHLHIGTKEIGVAYMLLPQKGDMVIVAPRGKEYEHNFGEHKMCRVTSIQQVLSVPEQLRNSYDLHHVDVVLEEVADI